MKVTFFSIYASDECLRYQKGSGLYKTFADNSKYLVGTYWLSLLITWISDGKPCFADHMSRQQVEEINAQKIARKEKLTRLPVFQEEASSYRKVLELETAVKHPSFTAYVKKIQLLEEKYLQVKAPKIHAIVAEEQRKKKEEDNYDNIVCTISESPHTLDAVRSIDELSDFPTSKELVSGMIYEFIDEALTEVLSKFVINTFLVL